MNRSSFFDVQNLLSNLCWKKLGKGVAIELISRLWRNIVDFLGFKKRINNPVYKK